MLLLIAAMAWEVLAPGLLTCLINLWLVFQCTFRLVNIRIHKSILVIFARVRGSGLRRRMVIR